MGSLTNALGGFWIVLGTSCEEWRNLTECLALFWGPTSTPQKGIRHCVFGFWGGCHAVLGASRGCGLLLGALRASTSPGGGLLVASWMAPDVSGTTWAVLGCSLSQWPFRRPWELLGRFLGLLGDLLGSLRGDLGFHWGVLEARWGPPGLSW